VKTQRQQRQQAGLHLDPNRSDLAQYRRNDLSQSQVGRTGERCTVLGGWWARGERLYKLRDSWFSAKTIQVVRVLGVPGKGRYHEGWVEPC